MRRHSSTGLGELRDVRPEEAIRAFIRAGGIMQAGKGSHVNIQMPNGQSVTLVRSRADVKIGRLKDMLKRAGISQEEFLRHLGRRR